MNGCYWPRSPACCHSGCLPATKVCADPAHILKTRPQTHHTTTPTTSTNLPTYLRTSWKRASSNEKDTKNINPSKKWFIVFKEAFPKKNLSFEHCPNWGTGGGWAVQIDFDFFQKWKVAQIGVLDMVSSYQIIVADAADAVSVNFSGRCKFWQI